MSDTTTQQERERAVMEAHQIAASDQWFAARQALDFKEMRRIYEAGYARAWSDRATLHQRDEPVAEGKACQTCNGSGVVGRAPDDYFNCHDCTPPSPSLREVQDAARYRWLRSIDSSGEWDRVGHYAADALDKIIDASLARLEGGG